jgi:RecB family exonuclease
VCGYKIKVISDSYENFVTELGSADLILTPTRRLATRLNQDYASLQAKNNNPVWQIDIISLNGWLERLWNDRQDDGQQKSILRLNAWQNLIVWQAITDNNEQLARLAIDAWSILKEWNIPWQSIDSNNVSSDIQVFLTWCQQYQALCAKENFCDSASMLSLLSPSSKELNKIYLIGFTDIKPAVLKLLDFNTHIEILEYRVPDAMINHAPQVDAKSELVQAALWAKALLNQELIAPIGIIIPDLAKRFNEVENIFSRTIMPQTLLANHYFDQKPYNISSGNKLSDFHIIAAAFNLLKNSLLREHKAPSEWSEFIKNLLHTSGWPGERVLNSLEYQVVKRFYELLTDYVTLDCVQKPISYATAVSQLYQQASTTVFQGESEHAPIQILGALEGEGLYFQNLWVMGLDNESWPPACAPHPFLPIDMQRQYHMPHASQEREYIFTSHLTRRFTEQAHHVILSYPAMIDDKTLQPSHLIRDYPILKQDTPAELEIFDLNLSLETWQDANVPFKKDKVSGGVGLLQSQSVCPFQAFARYRLKVEVSELSQSGLTFAERGELTHAALEYFWKTIESSTALHALNNDELNVMINTSVDHALTQFTPSKHLELEKIRLHKLVSDWLQLEKARSEFKVIHTEKSIDIELSHLKLRTRIDRIDQLSSGEVILIDYKTGQVFQNDWLDVRPRQVQLPLYAIGFPIASSVAIAKVKANDLQFQHYTEFDLPFDEMKAHWQNVLTELADEFFAGTAQVAPIDDEQTCRYCGLELLCRIRSA